MSTKYNLVLLSILASLTGCGGSGGSGGASTPTVSLEINEVLADNNSSNADPDFAEYGDWIELKNSSTTAIDLSGYGLSDKKSKIKWTFPANTQLAANGYLTVWADDHNTSLNAHHTNFKLSAGGDNVVLFSPNGTQLEEVVFKTQRADISWAKNANGEFVLTAQPTPGLANVISEKAISSKPIFSQAEGVYASPISVTLTAPSGSKIYYTTNGTDATLSSTLYTAPIDISLNTKVKAVSKEAGDSKLVSQERSYWYVISASKLHISEVLPENNSTLADENGNYGDIIELHNTDSAALDITGYGLGDSMKGAKWTFPAATIPADGKIRVWADDMNTTTAPYHTDFKLSANGDSAVLYDNTNTIIDFVKFKNIEQDQSLNREDNGTFTVQTPSF